MSNRVDCQLCGALVDFSKTVIFGGQRVCKKCKRKFANVPVLITFPAEQPPTALSMDGYLALVRGLPLPTAEQRRNFVHYVAGAHSWYKHLPGFLPGVPFYFFMDRAAGCDWLAMQDGSRAIAERKKQGFHYSDIPTAEYRARFGFLGYSCKEGTAVFLSGEPLAYPRDKVVTIPGEDAKPRYLPPALLKAGQAEATAVVHPYFARSPWLAQAHLLTEREIPLADRRLRWPQSEAQRPIYWPAESGGQTTLEKIFERFEQMHRPEWGKEMQERVERFSREKGWPAGNEELAPSEDPTCDPVLQKLIEPEQQRQWAEMLKAIDRVCALIQPGGP